MTSIHIRIPTFHDGQTKIWNQRGRRNAVRCGRRFGKTKNIITLACDGLIKGRKVGIFTPEHKQWQEPYDEIVATINPIISGKNKNDQFIKTETGGKADFWQLNDNDLAGRGREYDLILIDEAGFTKNNQMLDIWHKGIVPTMATKPNAYVWVFSTPNGHDPENFFYQVCHDPEMGFVEHHAPSWINPLVDRDWIEVERGRLHPDVFRQEIQAEWVDWSGVAFFGLDKMLENGAPVAYPQKCDRVFAVIDSAIKTGSANDGTAVTYYARNQYAGHPLVLLDYDIVQIEGALLDTWLTGVFQNLEHYSRACGAREGVAGVWIEDKSSGSILLQQARKRGLMVHPIGGSWMTFGKDERAMSVSSYHYQGMCKISQFAHDKVMVYKGTSRNHFIGQVTSFRIGDKDASKRADDLLDCHVHAVALALGDKNQF